MLRTWEEVTPNEGSAAEATAKLAKIGLVDGRVIAVDAMKDVLEWRNEQIQSLLNVLDPENEERVADELNRTILTSKVSKKVQDVIDDLFEILGSPIIMRLSPLDKVADPLATNAIIGIEDKKAALDALRILCAEQYSVSNLRIDVEDRNACIIVQKQPEVTETYRILRSGNYTVVEGVRGLGMIVSYGEPDRFLFENGQFVRAEHGDKKGINWGENLEQFERLPIGGEEAQELFNFAKDYLAVTDQPILFCKTSEGFQCLGAGTKLN